MFKFYLPHYDVSKINNYSEFDLKVEKREKIPTKVGDPLKHQELIGRFMKGISPVDSLLIVHDMGTGKSCTAIQAIEKNLSDVVYGMKSAIILNRGKAIMNNFINELTTKCTMKYQGSNNKIQKNLWSKFYKFDTFELFSKKVKNMSDRDIIKNYNNTFLVIDEVHNILNDESDVYQQISRFISLLPNKKVLLLSGTPVRDSPEDIVPILNLLFKPEEKIDVKTFKNLYYTNNNINSAFKTKILNRVSYLKASVPEIKIIYEGKKMYDLKEFNIVEHKMSTLQKKSYEKAYIKDYDSGGVFTYSRQASRFVFPDGSYGNEGFNTYIVDKKYRFRQNMRNALVKYGDDEESILKSIEEMSTKYAYIIRKILEADRKGEKSIVYDDLVRGSGLIVFSLLLQFLGFKKYRLITSDTSTLTELIKTQKLFNEDVRGKYISVLLGSRVIAEGFTFLDVLHEHIVPHWNNTETMQVVARGIRMGSHQKILAINPNAVVKVYRNVSISDNYKTSIDYQMTKLSETKDIEINKIRTALMESSITCNQFVLRNEGKCFENLPRSLVDDNKSLSITLNDDIVKSITNFFFNNHCTHVKTLQRELGLEINLLLSYVSYIISEKISFKNYKGITCYLNHSKNFIFTTEDIRTETDVSMSYYSQNLKPYISDSNNVLLYNNSLELELDDLSSNKNKNRLLELALTVRLCNLKVSNETLIDDILNEFEGSWVIDTENMTASSWLLSDNAEEYNGPSCLVNPKSDKPWKEWRKCAKQYADNIKDKRFAKINTIEDNLKKKNITHYGLWNSNNKEFCIKEIKYDDKLTEDKRKIASGKRCVNWSKNELIDIAKNNIGMDKDWDTWKEGSRKYICDDIKEWFNSNNLLIENKSCGVQTKRK